MVSKRPGIFAVDYGLDGQPIFGYLLWRGGA
jgi:hypothetical protein